MSTGPQGAAQVFPGPKPDISLLQADRFIEFDCIAKHSSVSCLHPYKKRSFLTVCVLTFKKLSYFKNVLCIKYVKL